MANRGAQHKQMPYSVILRYFLIKIKYAAKSVKSAAGHNQNEHWSRKRDKKPSPADKQKPAHRYIDYKAEDFFLDKKYFEQNAKQHQRPLDGKKGNSERVEHIYKQKRRISTGYQKIDRDMIPGAQYFFRVSVLHTVVKGAERKHHQKAESVNGRPDNARYITRTRANRRKNRNTRDAEQNSNPVR